MDIWPLPFPPLSHPQGIQYQTSQLGHVEPWITQLFFLSYPQHAVFLISEKQKQDQEIDMNVNIITYRLDVKVINKKVHVSSIEFKKKFYFIRSFILLCASHTVSGSKHVLSMRQGLILDLPSCQPSKKRDNWERLQSIPLAVLSLTEKLVLFPIKPSSVVPIHHRQ